MSAKRKSNMSGMLSDYQKMYDIIKNWNEDGFKSNEAGFFLYKMGWAIGEAPYLGWTGEALATERYHYEAVKKAHKALKVALQDALGIEQTEKEF